MATSRARASTSTSAGPISDSKRNGSRSWGSGSCSDSRVDLLGLQRDPVATEVGCRGERIGLAVEQRHPGGVGRLVGADSEPVVVDVEAVDDDRAEADADLVLERERGLDQFVHRGLLGQRDQDDLATLVVLEQLEDVAGLAVDRSDLHGVEQPTGRPQEGDGVSGGGRVEDEHVGGGGPLELLDLAEHEDVADARRRRCATTSSAPDDTSRLTMRDRPWSSRYSSRAPSGVIVRAVIVGLSLGSAALAEHQFVVAQPLLAEHPGQSRLALDLDDEGRPTGQRSRPGHGRRDHRFAHAAFPGNDEQPRCSEVLRRIHRLLSTTAGLVAGTESPYPGFSPASSSW